MPARETRAHDADADPSPAVLPYYEAQGDECELFACAHEHRLPLLLKGPTGCGKTRFVAHMAARLRRKLYTVACHDDLSAADLVGRFLLDEHGTRWVDGPLARAVREGAICYLDEVVEARKDVTVVLHPLTDDRRMLPIDKTGEEVVAAPGFMLVTSYNPGYQNVLKTLKPSTRQRFLAASLDFPPPELEVRILVRETGIDADMARTLVRLAGKLRALKGRDLDEGASTRLLVYAATLVVHKMPVERAIMHALIEPLTDDDETKRGLLDVVTAVFG